MFYLRDVGVLVLFLSVFSVWCIVGLLVMVVILWV